MTHTDYLTVASILAALAIQPFVFRIGRELTFGETDRRLPWAEYLVLATLSTSLLFVVLPAVVFLPTYQREWAAIAAGTCAAGAILMTAYPFAILCRYDIWLSRSNGAGQRIGKGLVIAAGAFAFTALVTLAVRRWP